MNRQQATTFLSNIECIKAFAEGKEIQVHVPESKNEWLNTSNPTFTLRNAYRIKPKQWYRVYQYGNGTATIGDNSICTEIETQESCDFIAWLTPRVYY